MHVTCCTFVLLRQKPCASTLRSLSVNCWLMHAFSMNPLSLNNSGTAIYRSPEALWPQNPQKVSKRSSRASGPECRKSVEKVPKDPKKESKRARKWVFGDFFDTFWPLRAQRLKKINPDWNFQSRLKISISIENFNPDLQNSPQKIGVCWVARLKFSISIENFNPGGRSWIFSIFGPLGTLWAGRPGKTFLRLLGDFGAAGCGDSVYGDCNRNLSLNTVGTKSLHSKFRWAFKMHVMQSGKLINSLGAPVG